MASQSIKELREYLAAQFGIEPNLGQIIDISEIVRLARISNKYTIYDKIIELNREIQSREKVYPNIVSKMRLDNKRYSVVACDEREQQLVKQSAVMMDILLDYKKLSDMF